MTTETAATTPPSCSTSAIGGLQRPAGRQDVVDDEDPLAGRHRVGVQLQRRRPVLERVVGRDPLARQLAGLADRDDADAGVQRHGRGEQEAAGLHADDDVEPGVAAVPVGRRRRPPADRRPAGAASPSTMRRKAGRRRTPA